MAITLGRVECLQVGDDFGFVGIREDETNDFEAFIIWFNPSLPTASTRLLHSMWLGMLRQALASENRVRISHDDDSAFIRTLQVNKSTSVSP